MILNILFLLNLINMSNLSKLKLSALDISGENYLSWILDVEIHFEVMNLGDTIKHENQTFL